MDWYGQPKSRMASLDFYFWGYLKNEVYSEEPTTVENMKERIRQACTNIISGILQSLE